MLVKLFWIGLLFVFTGSAFAQQKSVDMPIGYALNIHSISSEKMTYAKSLGIDYIELSNIGSLLDKNMSLKNDEEFWLAKVDSIRTILQEANVKVWSIHMPFSKDLDLSSLDDTHRQKVVAAQLQLVKVLQKLKPNIILFHPSYYLELNRRNERIDQLIKSVQELNANIAGQDMQMVVENMLGPELTIGNKERPLLRTVEECELVFDRLPANVGIAVDMCHIDDPERLIEKFGRRVKTLHVSDGNGKAETHYLPCSGQGENNWNSIFSALKAVNYKGVFMYECKYNDESELVDCYNLLVKNYEQYLKNSKQN